MERADRILRDLFGSVILACSLDAPMRCFTPCPPPPPCPPSFDATPSRLLLHRASVSYSGVTASSDPHFMVEYLVNTCGFSADDASKVSKLLPRSFQSTEKPDAVLGFFRSQGLDGANLRRIIARKPGLLGWDVETNLAPKFKLLREMGLSESDIIGVIRLHPMVSGFNSQNTLLPRLKFWESLFGSREILLKNLQSGWFFSSNIENVARPNMNFLLDECGIPEERVSLVIKKHPRFIVQNPDALRTLVDRANGIGIPREYSRMFLWILFVLHGVSREKFEAQVNLMNSFGWSMSDFTAAIKKCPKFLGCSIEALQRKMEFVIKDVEVTPSYIADHPIVLTFSLEKRLIPRFQLMKILKSEGLWKSTHKLHIFFT